MFPRGNLGNKRLFRLTGLNYPANMPKKKPDRRTGKGFGIWHSPNCKDVTLPGCSARAALRVESDWETYRWWLGTRPK